MTDQHNDMRATAREWRIALFVVLGGLVIAIAVAVYFAMQTAAQTRVASQAATAQTAEQRKEMALQVGKLLCDAELLNAKGIGIVPPYGKSASLPLRTDTRGRYACMVTTGVAKYLIAADVKCGTLLDPRCVEVYSVQSDDGTMLYKRPDKAPAK
jgi:uncharacterized membrane protein YraQ (UPF0718 family)